MLKTTKPVTFIFLGFLRLPLPLEVGDSRRQVPDLILVRHRDELGVRLPVRRFDAYHPKVSLPEHVECTVEEVEFVVVESVGLGLEIALSVSAVSQSCSPWDAARLSNTECRGTKHWLLCHQPHTHRSDARLLPTAVWG